MEIKLFEHNLEAYNAAVRMLDTTGKAAVIHPTGTGKSFIGFKHLIEYKRVNGNASPQGNYRADDGYNLGTWVGSQRKSYKKGTLNTGRIRKLENIVFVWQPQKANWNEHFLCAKSYFENMKP